jgi:TP901 family phage tail tape measure protein
MSIGAGIRTRADIEINLTLAKSAAWNKMQDELGDLKKFLNDIAKTVGIQKPIQEYEKLSQALAAAKSEVKALKDAQKAQKEQVLQSANATKEASKFTVVHTRSVTALKNGLKALQNMDDRATEGLVAGWKEAGNGAYAFQARLGNTAQIVGQVAQNFNMARQTINYFTDATDNSENATRSMTRSLVQLDEGMVQLNAQMKAEDALYDELEKQMIDAARRAVSATNANESLEASIHRVTVRMREQRELMAEKANWNAQFRQINNEIKIREANERALRKETKARAAAIATAAREKSVLEKLVAAKKADEAATTTLAGRINKYERQLDAVFRASFRLQMAGNDLKQFARMIYQFGSQMMNLFGEFEYMMNRAAGAMQIWGDATNTSAVKIDDLQNALLGASEEMRMFQPAEVAEAMYYWGSTTGQVVSTTRDLGLAMKALNPIMKVAAMTNTGYEDTIKGVYSILAQYYNGAVSQAGRVTELLFYATQKTAAELPDLINSFKMVGPIAAANNVKFEDMVNILGRLADLGVRGTMAGRAFRQMFIQLVRPSGPAMKAINNLFEAAKKSVDEFDGKSYYELMFPAGEFVGTDKYLRNLALAVETLTQAERNSFLAKIATANELPILTALVNDQIRALHGLKSATKEGMNAQEEATFFFEQNWKLLENSWKGVTGAMMRAWEALQIQVGSVMAEVLKPLVDQVREVINAMREWAMSPANKQIIAFIGKVAAIGAAAAAAVGSLLVAAGAFMGVAAAIAVAVRAFRPLFGAIGGMILGVTALADAFIRNFDEVQSSVQYAVDTVADAINDANTVLVGGQVIVVNTGKAFDEFADAVSAATKPIRAISDLIVKFGAYAVRVLGDFVAYILELNKTIPIINALASLMGVLFSVKLIGLVAGFSKVIAVFAARVIGLTKLIAIIKALRLAWLGFAMVPSPTVIGQMDKVAIGAKGLIGVVSRLKAVVGLGGIFGLVLGAGFVAYEMNIGGFADGIDRLTSRFRDIKTAIKEVAAEFGTASQDIEDAAYKVATSFFPEPKKTAVTPEMNQAAYDQGFKYLAEFADGTSGYFTELETISSENARLIEAKSEDILNNWKTGVEIINKAIAGAVSGAPIFTPNDFGATIEKLTTANPEFLAEGAQNALMDVVGRVLTTKGISGENKAALVKLYNEWTDGVGTDVAEIQKIGLEKFVSMFYDQSAESARAVSLQREAKTALYQPLLDELVKAMSDGASPEYVRSLLMKPLKGVMIGGTLVPLQDGLASVMTELAIGAQDVIANGLEFGGTTLSAILGEDTEIADNIFEETWGPLMADIRASIKSSVESTLYDNVLLIEQDMNNIAKDLQFSGIGTPLGAGAALKNIIGTIREGALKLPDEIWASLVETGEFLESTGGISSTDLGTLMTLYEGAAEKTVEIVEKTFSEYVDAFTSGVDFKPGAFKKSLKEALKRGTNFEQIGNLLKGEIWNQIKKGLRGNMQSKQLALDAMDTWVNGELAVLEGTEGPEQQKIGLRIARHIQKNWKNMPESARVKWQPVLNYLLGGNVVLPPNLVAKLSTKVIGEVDAAVAGVVAAVSQKTGGNTPIAERIGQELEQGPWSRKGKDATSSVGAIKVDVKLAPNVTMTAVPQETMDTLVKASVQAPMQVSVDKITVDATTAGSSTGNSFGSGFNGNTTAVIDTYIRPAVLTMISGMNTETTRLSASSAGSSIGTAFAKGVGVGIQIWSSGAAENSTPTSAINDIKSALNQKDSVYNGGYSVGQSWARGFKNGVLVSTNALLVAFSATVVGNSPPPKGPLKNIDKGGLNIGKAWGRGVAQGAQSEAENGLRKISKKFAERGGAGSFGFEAQVTKKKEIDINIHIKGGGDASKDTVSQMRKGVYDALVDNDILSHMVTIS